MPGVTYVTGSVLEPDTLRRAVADADIVFEAVSPRGDMAGRVEDVFASLIALAIVGMCGLHRPVVLLRGSEFENRTKRCASGRPHRRRACFGHGPGVREGQGLEGQRLGNHVRMRRARQRNVPAGPRTLGCFPAR